MLEIIGIPALTDNYTFILRDPLSMKTAVIDPAEAEPVLSQLDKQGQRLDYVLNTHHHFDHVGSNLQLKQLTGCQIIAAEADRHRIPGIDIGVAQGDRIQIGYQFLDVMETPGHTLGHISFYSESNQSLFCGDTLFSMGCGRLFEGSAEQMWRTLQIFKNLPPLTKIYCAHEYTQLNSRFALSIEGDNLALNKRAEEVNRLRSNNLSTIPTTIEQELATNPFFREDSPTIRSAIAVNSEASPVEVFARIRLLRNEFR